MNVPLTPAGQILSALSPPLLFPPSAEHSGLSHESGVLVKTGLFHNVYR